VIFAFRPGPHGAGAHIAERADLHTELGDVVAACRLHDADQIELAVGQIGLLDVDTELLPREVRRIFFLKGLDRVAVDRDRVWAVGDIAAEGASGAPGSGAAVVSSSAEPAGSAPSGSYRTQTSLFTVGRPSLAVADGVFAVAAIAAGLDTIAFADLDAPAPALAAARGRPVEVVTVASGRPPGAYLPVRDALLEGLGGPRHTP